MKFSRLSGAALAVAALVAAMVASAAYGISTAGVNGQLDFKSCVSDSGSDTCTDVVAMDGPSAIALADDESRVFAVSPSDDAVAVFSRDRGTGKLEQLKMDPSNNKGGCTQEGDNPPCLPGHGLNGANDVASAGGNAYIAATGSNAVVTLTKDPQSGRWKELDNNGSNQQFCLSTPAIAGCAGANGLGGATSIAAVGGYVYVAGPGRIAAFRRGTKGALKQLSGDAGCIGTGTGCTGGLGLGTIVDMMATRDNRTLYAVDGSDAAGVLAEPRAQARSRSSPARPCRTCPGRSASRSTSRGFRTNVYVAGSNNVVGVFARNKSTGALTQLAGTDGCVSAGGGACTAAPRLANIGALTQPVRLQDEPVRLRRRGRRRRRPSDGRRAAFTRVPWLRSPIRRAASPRRATAASASRARASAA